MKTRPVFGKPGFATVAATILAASTAACLAATITAQPGYTVNAYVNPFAGTSSNGGNAAVDGSSGYARTILSADQAFSYLFNRGGGGNTNVLSVFAYQYSYTGFDSDSPWNVQAGSTTVASGSGSHTSGGLFVFNSGFSPVAAATLSINFTHLAHYPVDGKYYGDFQEVMPFDKPYAQLSPTISTYSAIYYNAGELPLILTNTRSGADPGWFPGTPVSPDTTRYIEFGLGGTQNLGLAVFWIDSRMTGFTSMDLQVLDGSVWKTIGTATGMAANDFVAFQIPGGIPTGSLRLDVGSGGNANVLSKAFFFAEIPEPSALMLLALSGLLAARRRRRGR